LLYFSTFSTAHTRSIEDGLSACHLLESFHSSTQRTREITNRATPQQASFQKRDPTVEGEVAL
jgi:hypothetical protein